MPPTIRSPVRTSRQPAVKPAPKEAQPNGAVVVTKALVRAANYLGLSQGDIAAVLQTSPATVSRIFGQDRPTDPTSVEGKFALLFLRVFRSLDALVGGDSAKANAWLLAENHHLGGAPLARMKTIEGLVHVADYLDAMRGKI